MVDTARQLLDELMGRNRNLDPTSAKVKKVHWDDPEFCLYYLVKFCPHDLFVNTRADLGQCSKLHDDEAKRLFEEARHSARKRYYEDEFLRFSNHMINEVDRKIEKGKQRLLLMNKTPEGAPPVFVSKYQEQLNNLDARIKKLIGEAEEAGNRGDVDQAQGLMTLCDQLKEEKESLIKNHEINEAIPGNTPNADIASPGNGASSAAAEKQWAEYPSNEKQMEVCEVCGAFLIVGDAQQRIEDHLSGKQHLGYSKLRRAVEEMYESRKKQREEEERIRDEDRKQKIGNGFRDRERRDRDDRHRRRDDFDDRRRGDRDRDRDRRGDRDRYNSQRDRERGERDRDRRNERDRHSSSSNRDRDRDRERERDRDREGSHRSKNDERSDGDRRERRNHTRSRSRSKQ